jgi:hypothetical protein
MEAPVIRRALTSAILCMLLASSASAQLATQTALVGTVTDQSGSVLPGATITAVNVATQDKYEAVTNAEGRYNIQFVRIGTYEIRITLAGFQTSVATGVSVTTNQIARTDAVLRIGEVAESVTVAATALLLATDSASVKQTISERAVEDLPLTGRSGAGQRSIQNSLSMDGINTAANLLTSTTMRPIVDGVTEVEVQTGSTSAEYGSYLGVYINVVTKSGTNDLRGSVYEFLRNDALNARGYFENRGIPANPLRFNQFGTVVGGPVVLPKLYDGRNRTFFMAAWEGVRSTRQSSSLITLPTAAMRRGDFSEYPGTIRNPYTAVPYVNNIIPREQLSSEALRLLDYFPLPNLPGIVANYRADVLTKANTNQALARIDQNIGNRVRLYARYNGQDESNDNGATISVNSRINPRNNKNFLFAYTHTLTPSLLNDFRIGYHKVTSDDLNYFSYSNLPTAGSDLGIPGFDSDVRFNNPGIPSFFITDMPELGAGGTNWLQEDTTFQLADVLAYSHGSHNIRTGFDLRRLATGRAAANESRGRFNFTGQMTGGHAAADFMLGVPARVVTPMELLWGHVASWRNGLFINDSWQLAEKMTLSLGLRYELDLPAYTTTGWASMLNADQTALIPETLPAPGFKFTNPEYTNFAPRLGMTYRVTPKTVLRAGFGLYYNPNQTNTFTFLTTNPPLNSVYTYNQTIGNVTMTLANPTGVATVVARPDVTSPRRDLPAARKTQWSFDFQRELTGSTGLQVQYIGSHTDHLDRGFMNNTPQPGPGAIASRQPNQLWGVLRTIQNDLVSDYHAVSFILRQNVAHGLQGVVHYTWSGTWDMASHSNSTAGRGMDPYDIQREYARASIDVPHRFVASYIYNLPFFEKSDRRILRTVLAGWQISGITTIESGTPINVTIAGDRANTGTSLQRPDMIGTPTANCGKQNLINCISSDAFAMPALYTYGNSPRNQVRGPGSISTDLSLTKDFRLKGRARLQLRAEAFNAFNRANFGDPASVWGSSSFGRITSADNMREVQLGLKVIF